MDIRPPPGVMNGLLSEEACCGTPGILNFVLPILRAAAFAESLENKSFHNRRACTGELQLSCVGFLAMCMRLAFFVLLILGGSSMRLVGWHD